MTSTRARSAILRLLPTRRVDAASRQQQSHGSVGGYPASTPLHPFLNRTGASADCDEKPVNASPKDRGSQRVRLQIRENFDWCSSHNVNPGEIVLDSMIHCTWIR